MLGHDRTRRMTSPRHIVGFFIVLVLMVSGAFDAIIHTVGLQTPPLLSLIFIGFAAALLQRWPSR